MHNRLMYSALQFLHFHTAKQAVLHGKNMPFAVQNSLFQNTKPYFKLFVGIILTNRKSFQGWF
ncbi:MAG: hypothetical protein D8B57_06030 [Prevotella sp.]|nr:MAG: hypothetical protein D8B57_06030 [Prevotella sp.]